MATSSLGHGGPSGRITCSVVGRGFEPRKSGQLSPLVLRADSTAGCGGFLVVLRGFFALLGNAPCTSAANAFKCLTAMFTEGYTAITSQYQVNSGSETAPNSRNLPPASCCRCPGIRQTERTQYHHCMKTNFLWTSQVQEVILLPKQTRQRATFFQSKEQTTVI